MLKAVISHNEQAAIVELPMDRLSLQYELSQIGIRRLAKDIPIMDEEDQPISVKLYSEADIGQNLAALFRPSHSLEDANVCAHAVVHARRQSQDSSGRKRTNHRDIQRRHRGGAAADRMIAAHRCPNLEGSRFFVRVQVPMQNQRKNLFIVLPQLIAAVGF